MSTDHFAPSTDAELLLNFLSARIEGGGREAPVDQLMSEFAEYRRELNDLRSKLREAEESSARGESGPLDLEALFARVDKRLENEGIPE